MESAAYIKVRQKSEFTSIHSALVDPSPTFVFSSPPNSSRGVPLLAKRKDVRPSAGVPGCERASILFRMGKPPAPAACEHGRESTADSYRFSLQLSHFSASTQQLCMRVRTATVDGLSVWTSVSISKVKATPWPCGGDGLPAGQELPTTAASSP
jgi:hypothetical protein